MAARLPRQFCADGGHDEPCREAIHERIELPTATGVAALREHAQGRGKKKLARCDGVDHAVAQRLLRGWSLAAENDFQRARHADQARQPGRAAPRGQDAEARLGQADLGRAVVRGDAVGAGQRELAAAPEAYAVDRGDRGNLQVGNSRENILALLDEMAAAVAVHLLEPAQIRAGDERRAVCR